MWMKEDRFKFWQAPDNCWRTRRITAPRPEATFLKGYSRGVRYVWRRWIDDVAHGYTRSSNFRVSFHLLEYLLISIYSVVWSQYPPLLGDRTASRGKGFALPNGLCLSQTWVKAFEKLNDPNINLKGSKHALYRSTQSLSFSTWKETKQEKQVFQFLPPFTHNKGSSKDRLTFPWIFIPEVAEWWGMCLFLQPGLGLKM